MRRKILIPIAVLLIIVGIGFFLFEPVSKEIGKAEAEKAVRQFDELADEIGVSEDKDTKKKTDSEGGADNGSQVTEYYSDGRQKPTRDDILRLREDSLKYNKKILNHQGTVKTKDYTKPALNLINYHIYDNVYGYISAPTIGMQLPVYLGGSDNTMNYGAANLGYTSLPTGGKNTNCVIAGHTGYIGRVYFDNLSGLSIGDTVTVRNYWKRISYNVIKKRVVDDKTSDYMFIQSGRSLLTLVTCVDDGKGGFDRLIVTCEEM